MKALYLLIGICFIISACSPSAQQLTATALAIPTNTPTATQTPLPTNTATPTATATPRPTKTPIPPTFTPAAVGDTVIFNSLEITVLDVITHSHIVPGGLYYYYSKPGQTFIDIGVRVRNLKPGTPVTIAWENVFVMESKNEAWYPMYGDVKQVESGKSYDPFSIEIKTEVIGSRTLKFDNDTYLRLIYYVSDDPNKVMLFAIGNSQPIKFQIKK